jgi:hypothetical protein
MDLDAADILDDYPRISTNEVPAIRGFGIRENQRMGIGCADDSGYVPAGSRWRDTTDQRRREEHGLQGTHGVGMDFWHCIHICHRIGAATGAVVLGAMGVDFHLDDKR